jgi:hypothetical protein
VPLDDRYAQHAQVSDLSCPLMSALLQEAGSAPAEDAAQLPPTPESLEALGRQMNLVGGRSEAPWPKNVGLLFFEVRISHEERVVVSYPGPDRSINLADFTAGRAVSRRYRNRRIRENSRPLLKSKRWNDCQIIHSSTALHNGRALRYERPPLSHRRRHCHWRRWHFAFCSCLLCRRRAR